MDQPAERLLLRELDLHAVQIPLRLFVALGDPQKEIARRRQAARKREMGEGAERVAEPAARPLGHEAQRSECQMLRFVKTVEHSRPCSCYDTLVITELRRCRIVLSEGC